MSDKAIKEHVGKPFTKRSEVNVAYLFDVAEVELPSLTILAPITWLITAVTASPI